MKITVDDYQNHCVIDMDRHILTLNNQFNFLIPDSVFDLMIKTEEKITQH